MSWHINNKVLEEIAEEHKAQRIFAKGGKFVLSNGTVVEPKPIPGGHFIVEILGLGTDEQYHNTLPFGNIDFGAKYIEFYCALPSNPSHPVACSVVLYK